MHIRRTFIVAASAIMLGMAMPAAALAKTIDVVASFTILADVVKNIGGDHVNVKSLVPPNGDPHDFEPSPDDAKSLKEASVTFVSGEGLETWFERLAKAAGTQTPPVVVSEGIKTHEFEDDGKTVTDPHIWNSVPNVIIWVGNIEKALAAADPENAATFKANADRYRKELEALNSEVHTKIDAVPVEKRKVLTSHDAFGYYGKEYGVSFLAPLGISTEAEASAADVAELIEQIKKEGIKVYFIENSNDPRLVKQIADATGAAAGGVLYPEALSAADGPASTYIKMMQYNTGELAAAIAK